MNNAVAADLVHVFNYACLQYEKAAEATTCSRIRYLLTYEYVAHVKWFAGGILVKFYCDR